MIQILRSIKRKVHQITAPGKRDRSNAAAERVRLKALPRYVETFTHLPGFRFKIPDAASFLASWEEIFDREIYDFKCNSDSPRILDCGANVGVSCLYFCRRFPNARITAFEPDPKIFSYLKENLVVAGCNNVEIVEKAVWLAETKLDFKSEGSDSGRIITTSETDIIEIKTVRLRDYLDEKIDFLKIDIEGAEYEVIADIEPHLSKIENIFVEYHSFEGQPQSLASLIKLLSDGGFRLQIQHNNAARSPLIEVPSQLGMDLQLNIFGYRAKK